VICGQGVAKADIEPGEEIVIVGAGVIGLLAQRLAMAMGAAHCTVVAASRQKEPVARAGGAARFLVAGEDEGVIAALRAPIVIEATGDPDAIAVAVAAAGANGRVVLLGSPRGVTRRLPVDEIRSKDLTLIGAHVETLTSERRRSGGDPHARTAEHFLALLAEGALEVEDLSQRVVDPRETDGFYRDLAQRRDIVAARLDWSRIPRAQRVRRVRLARLPDLRARGLDPQKHLLPATLPASAEADPLARSVGDLRVGLVGCGDIAVHNAAAIAASPNARLTACFDPVASLAADLAGRYGAAVSATLDALLDRADVDAVFIAVPHHLHAPLAIQCARAGKHVIVEKPMANDLAGALEMAAAADEAGVVLSVCFPHRYDPTVQAARRLVRAGAIGELGGTLTTFFADKPSSYWLGGFSGRSVSNWRSSPSKAGGGLLIMNLSHMVDLARHVGGVEVEACSAVTDVARGAEAVEDTVSVSIGYANGAAGTLFGSAALRGNRGRPAGLDMWGPDGYLTVEPQGRIFTGRALSDLHTGRWQRLAGLPERNIRAEYVTRLATAIALEAPPEIGAQDGIAVQAFIEAAYGSRDRGAAVRVADLVERAATSKRRAA
jgi:predicted dehydrogenase